MDTVFIKGLKLKARIGIYEWEKQTLQTLKIDVEMQTNTEDAAQSNDVANTINYEAVAKRMREFVEAEVFNLVENTAERIAKIIMDEFGVTWLRLRLAKPNVFQDIDEVGVVIERGQMAS
tara:strand:- start:22929 stop:23288 length:360 start_codon:yes stop_codon:yes gene_type:complete